MIIIIGTLYFSLGLGEILAQSRLTLPLFLALEIVMKVSITDKPARKIRTKIFPDGREISLI